MGALVHLFIDIGLSNDRNWWNFFLSNFFIYGFRGMHVTLWHNTLRPKWFLMVICNSWNSFTFHHTYCLIPVFFCHDRWKGFRLNISTDIYLEKGFVIHSLCDWTLWFRHKRPFLFKFPIKIFRSCLPRILNGCSFLWS